MPCPACGQFHAYGESCDYRPGRKPRPSVEDELLGALRALLAETEYGTAACGHSVVERAKRAIARAEQELRHA